MRDSQFDEVGREGHHVTIFMNPGFYASPTDA